ncbi:aspartate-semialdehyde dehydrogenase [Allofrancisella frigidaquae]|uniref:Aspartate-semialdehyde dehydrogenase n=1 Tax=Allofrancisella frigidaquae TaxID=1085644 RepID=A0A6M3HRZ9_9GAMM|nr:aspartate-semialdehyde dehydrogenase [Allofrancisella frigidaquae]QIV93935.1 aspartate-semialdehyde dehydrogenase [Allofrancisella frigidaquae]
MKQVGFIGWRGMVGSTLVRRMLEEGDFNSIKTVFFSTSLYGQKAPEINNLARTIENAYDLGKLLDMDIIVTCQGSEYTQKILHKLNQKGWQGFWLDAASEKRMNDDSTIVLDPVNYEVIYESIEQGIKNFIGGNCTVSLMMLGIHGLIKSNLIRSISSMSYQAVSGSGAKAINELIQQSNLIIKSIKDPKELSFYETVNQKGFPCSEYFAPIAFNLIPFIDSKLENGQSREEWKAQAELNKILNRNKPILVDGICVRVPVFRAHSQALTIELERECSIEVLEDIISSANPWVKLIENTPQATAKYLTPLAVTDTLDIAVGRLKKTNLSNKHIQLFTVGDQLLWGAAEPLRRALKIILNAV